jgi:hypothetical protein
VFDILAVIIQLDGIVDNDGEVLYYEANKFPIKKKFHLLLLFLC